MYSWRLYSTRDWELWWKWDMITEEGDRHIIRKKEFLVWETWENQYVSTVGYRIVSGEVNRVCTHTWNCHCPSSGVCEENRWGQMPQITRHRLWQRNIVLKRKGWTQEKRRQRKKRWQHRVRNGMKERVKKKVETQRWQKGRQMERIERTER